ncbi:MAG: prolipoprotein diacylglyceryl transferase [Ilumatobacteraceae bacterium]
MPLAPAAFPAPPGASVSVGPLDIRMYGLMIGLGVIAAVWLLGRRLVEIGAGTTDDAASIATWGVAAGIVGARLYHVATDWDRFADDLGAIPAIWKGGLGIPGGLLVGIVAGLWVARRRGLVTADVLWAVAPALPLGQAIGRWGNWFNQELFGLTTDLPWGLSVDDAYLPAGAASGTLFHPTFLYESMWNLGLAGVLIVVGRHWGRNGGGLLAVYVAGYGLGRFWVEGLRMDRADELAGLRWNQWVAAAAVVGGVALAVRVHRRASGVVGEDVVPDSDAAPSGHHDDGLGTPPVA